MGSEAIDRFRAAFEPWPWRTSSPDSTAYVLPDGQAIAGKSLKETVTHALLHKMSATFQAQQLADIMSPSLSPSVHTCEERRLRHTRANPSGDSISIFWEPV